MAPLVRAVGGTVVLHDWVLFDLTMARYPALGRGGLFGRGLALREGGLGELATYARRLRRRRGPAGGDLSDDRFELPLNRSVVRFADAFLVHSEALKERILASRNAPTPIGVVPHGSAPTWSPDDRAAARADLGLSPSAFVVASFGKVQAHKRPDVLLDAFARVRRERQQAELALVGEQEPEVYDVGRAVDERGLAEAVHRPGRVPEDAIATWLAASDVAVQLRGPSTGGTSGAAFRAYSAGRAVVASDHEEQRELPAGCTRFVAPGPDEAERLAELLVRLADDPEARAALELEARRFVSEEAHWDRVAERYVQHLERFPRARASRRALFVLALQRSRAERAS